MFSLLDKEFTWTDEKNRKNIKKHGMALPEAAPVFLDPYIVIVYDSAHSSHNEVRWKGIGLLGNSLLVSVVFTEETDNIIHLISAREASPKEKEGYRENISQIFGA
jgi:uncharacterized DUF497 family protein